MTLVVQEAANWLSLMERSDDQGRQRVVAAGRRRQRHRDDPGRSRRVRAGLCFQYANLGVVVGTPPVGPSVTDSDPSHWFVVVLDSDGDGVLEDVDKCAGTEFDGAPIVGPTVMGVGVGGLGSIGQRTRRG